MDLVPGYADLGKGFNGFGKYSASSTDSMGRLFDTSKPGSNEWTNPSSNTQYTVPQNVSVGPQESREAQAVVFDGRSEMSSFFSAEAGVSGSFLSFSGSLNAGFETISKATSEYLFGMVYAFTEGYKLSITEATSENLAPEVLSDPDFTNLPDTYDASDATNQAAFFRFFEKYGTHFVSSITMGGRMFYNIWIQKSFRMNQTTFKADMSAEYDGVFSASASAKTKWEQTSADYANLRQVKIQALGGNEQTLNILPEPSKETSYAAQYKEWIDSVGARPSPVGFGLTGIEKIFSGAQYDSVLAAAQDYSASNLTMQYFNGAASLSVKGVPAFNPVQSASGLAFAAYDRKTLEIVHSGTFPMTLGGQYADGASVYNEAAKELAQFNGNGDVIVALMVWDVVHSDADSFGYPTATMHDFIVSLGAGDGFARWSVPTGSGPIGSAGRRSHLSYGIVGIPGSQPGTAFEDFNSNHQPEVSPEMSLVVYLRPEPNAGGGVIYALN